MRTIASIVEGDGEVAALPVLLRRLAGWLTQDSPQPRVLPPIRVRRDKFLNRPDELSRHVQLAAQKCGDGGWILILLDADDDCPALLGDRLMRAAMAHAPHRAVSVVLANREFEAWFIASAPSLEGCRGLRIGAAPLPAAETPRDAKGWVRQFMPGRAYGPTTDQPAFAARMDLAMARAGSRSFRKLTDEWVRHMAPRANA